MKAGTFMGIVALGALFVIFSGTSQAGGWMNQSSGGERTVEQAMGQGSSETAPEFWTYEYWQASEAGSLASHAEGGASTKVEATSDRWGISDPIVLEAGPFQYREVDLGE